MPTSSSPDPALRAYAETPDRYALLSADVERFDDGRVCVLQGAAFASVSGVSVPDGALERLVADVRELLPAAKRPVWQLGPSTRPADAEARLRALGLSEPVDRAPELVAFALVREPPAVAGVTVRRVETLDDFAASAELMWDAFDRGDDIRRRERPHLRASFEAQRATGHLSTFLALLDGRPAGVGRTVHSARGGFLIAGSVAPWARGRGLYRALVRARWEEVAARGTPALVTHAVPDTSAPILRRLGFEEICRIRRLQDLAYPSGSTAPDS